jgi:DNA-binding response OmpR family regulator
LTYSILVVDDESTILNFMELLLKDSDYKSYFVNSINNALDLLKKEEIDLIITDIYFEKDLDGINLLFRSREINSNVGIIAMTGHPDLFPLDYCLSLGFDDVLYKPFKVVEFNAVLEGVIGKRERWKALRKKYPS